MAAGDPVDTTYVPEGSELASEGPGTGGEYDLFSEYDDLLLEDYYASEEPVSGEDPMQRKTYGIVDPIFLSGSSETFRTAVGGYWYIDLFKGETVSETHRGVNNVGPSRLAFQEYNKDKPLYNFFSHVESNSSLRQIASEDTIIPSMKMPFRIYGNGEKVLNDKHWRDLILGGSFAGEEILPIYNEDVYRFTYLVSSLPYTKIESSILGNAAISDVIQITCDYNNYLPDYEAHVRNLDSELLIPNYYVITDLQSYRVSATSLEDLMLIGDTGWTEYTTQYDADVLKFATFEGNYLELDGLFNYNLLAWPPSIDIESEEVKDQTYLAINYLSTGLVRNPLSSSTQEAIKNKFQNIIIDDDALRKLYNEDNISQYSEFFPYYVKIDFPLTKTKFNLGSFEGGGTMTTTSTTFVDYIMENKYTTKFLKTLKEVFNEEIPALLPEKRDYYREMNFLSSSESSPVVYDVQAVDRLALRSVNFSEMLTYNYNNFRSETDNCYFIGNKNIYRDSVFDKFGSYRFMNTISAIDTLNNLITGDSNIDQFFNDLGDTVYNDAYNPNETLAYRIQKVGGSPTGDGREQQTLQNYWFINSSELEEFKFYDTQVKYGQDYTYHVYEYVLALGTKYKFSDLRLTQAVGVNNESEESGTTYYGLEFYDPETGEKVEQIFNEETSFTSDLASLVQEKSKYPYLADFYVNYEPCLMIFEVPVFSKTLKVLR